MFGDISLNFSWGRVGLENYRFWFCYVIYPYLYLLAQFTWRKIAPPRTFPANFFCLVSNSVSPSSLKSALLSELPTWSRVVKKTIGLRRSPLPVFFPRTTNFAELCDVMHILVSVDRLTLKLNRWAFRQEQTHLRYASRISRLRFSGKITQPHSIHQN